MISIVSSGPAPVVEVRGQARNAPLAAEGERRGAARARLSFAAELRQETGASAILALDGLRSKTDAALRKILDEGSCRGAADLKMLMEIAEGLEKVFTDGPTSEIAEEGARVAEGQRRVAEGQRRVAELEGELRTVRGELEELRKTHAEMKENYDALKEIQEREPGE